MTDPFKYREVRGTFLASVGDTVDADLTPDSIPLNGSVKLTPQYSSGAVSFDTGVLVSPQEIVAAIVDGELRAVVSDGEGGLTYQDLHLPVTVDERADQTWYWIASFPELAIGDTGQAVKLDSRRFAIEDGEGPINLTAVASARVSGAILTKGAPGVGVASVSAVGGEALKFDLTDGTFNIVDLPDIGGGGVDEGAVRDIVDQRISELPSPTADQESVIRAMGFYMVVSEAAPAEPTYTLSDGTVVRVVWQKPMDVFVPVFPETPYWNTHARTVLVPSLVGVEYRVTSVTKGGVTTQLDVVIPGGDAFDLDSAVSVSVPYDLRVDAVAMPGYILPHEFGWSMRFPDMSVVTIFTSEAFSGLEEGTAPRSWQSDAALGGVPRQMTVPWPNHDTVVIEDGAARLLSRAERSSAGVAGIPDLRVPGAPEDLILEFDLITAGAMPLGSATGLNLSLGGLEVWFQSNTITARAPLEGGGNASGTLYSGRAPDGRYVIELTGETIALTGPDAPTHSVSITGRRRPSTAPIVSFGLAQGSAQYPDFTATIGNLVIREFGAD